MYQKMTTSINTPPQASSNKNANDINPSLTPKEEFESRFKQAVKETIQSSQTGPKSYHFYTNSLMQGLVFIL
ncbi:MAG: hypothetical protein Fur0023_16410 [Bacteroidia bacterium]